MLKSRFLDYNDAYIYVKGNITVPNTTAATAATNNGYKKVILKACALFTGCLSEIHYA